MKFVFCPKEIHHFREIGEALLRNEKTFYEKCLTHTELFDLRLKPFQDVVEDVTFNVIPIESKHNEWSAILTIKYTLKS